MRASFSMEFNDFDKKAEMAITKVGRGTKKATIEACQDILVDSQSQVPKDTSTLVDSSFYEVRGNYRDGFEGIIGYGGNGDPINPKTGEHASEYMVVVHEDLDARHPNGKAKYLEDPVRDYALRKYPRTVIRNVKEELEG